MARDHEHGSAADGRSGGARYQRRLLWSFAIIGGDAAHEATHTPKPLGERSSE